MYDRYEFDPDIQKEMQDFETLIAREKAKLEAYKRQDEARSNAYWDRIKSRENPPTQKSVTPYTTPRELFQSCLKKTPNGGGYFALGEYYQKLNGR